MKIITRWNPDDLISGVSDISVYEWCSNNGIDLYLNSDLHLKLYLFDSNRAVLSTANVSDRGLGYCSVANVEAAIPITFDSLDWEKLNGLLADSLLVTEEVFQIHLPLLDLQNASTMISDDQSAIIDGFKHELEVLIERNSLIKQSSERLQDPAFYLTTQSLPALKYPERLLELFEGMPFDNPEEERRYHHDRSLFIPGCMTIEQAEEKLIDSFTTHGLICLLIEWLKERDSAHFGAVNSWLHSHLRDTPLPYRSEVKDFTNTLYNWLEWSFHEIQWDVPGARSQVIRWNSFDE